MSTVLPSDREPTVLRSTIPRLQLFRLQRRMLVALALSVAACVLVDYELYAREWFLNHVGFGTQEGQIVRKLKHSERLAAAADVIAFGSSFIRSSVSSEPFLAHGLLPFNFAVSGGGPIYSYYALEHIAPVLAGRTDKPLILMELSRNALDRAYAEDQAGSWSEYQHVFGTARSRSLVARHFGLLLSNFKEYSQLPEFLLTAAFPSLGYRTMNRFVGSLPSREFIDLLTGDKKNDYFFAMEDIGGFAPSYTVAPIAPPPVDWVPIPLNRFVPAKIDFLRLFLSVASRVGSRVVLVPSPTPQPGYYLAFERLAATLEQEFPHVRALRHPDYGLQLSDFDPTGHMNIWGSDHLSEFLITRLELSGNDSRLHDKIRSVFEDVPIPLVASWTVAPDLKAVADGPELLWPANCGSNPSIAASSPWIPATPDREYVLELSTSSARHRFVVEMSDREATDPVRSMKTVAVPETVGATRYFARLVPHGDRFTVRIRCEPLPQAEDPRPVGIRLNRLYGYL